MENKELNFSELLINVENPRFDPVSNQKEALDLMLKKHGEEIKKLALDIATHGLNPSKKLIVVEHKGKYIPQEGNRRTVALLLLNDPNKTENKEYRDYFKKIKLEFGNKIPQKISTVVFDNKNDASKWVNLEHTGKNNGVGVLPWNSEQRSRFVAMYNGNKSKSLQIFDFTDSNLLKRENVDPTTLDRIISSPVVRKLIGIDFKDGNLEIKKDEKETLSNLDKVFNKMSQKKFKVGDVYTAIQRESWIKDVLGVTDKNKESSNKNKEDKDILKSDKKPQGLFYPSKIPFKLGNRQLQKLYDELKDPNILKFPNATHDLLRSFLECSLTAYLKHNKIKKFEIMLVEKKKKDGDQTLTNMLDFISKSSQSPISDQSVKDLAWQLISDDDSVYSVKRMNMINHNENWCSDEPQVKKTWEKLEPLFKIILNP